MLSATILFSILPLLGATHGIIAAKPLAAAGSGGAALAAGIEDNVHTKREANSDDDATILWDYGKREATSDEDATILWDYGKREADSGEDATILWDYGGKREADSDEDVDWGNVDWDGSGVDWSG